MYLEIKNLKNGKDGNINGRNKTSITNNKKRM